MTIYSKKLDFRRVNSPKMKRGKGSVNITIAKALKFAFMNDRLSQS